MEARLVREDGKGHQMYELEGQYYIVWVQKNSNQFQSSLPDDNPADGTKAFARQTDEGLKYVAKGRSKRSADAMWRRYYS